MNEKKKIVLRLNHILAWSPTQLLPDLRHELMSQWFEGALPQMPPPPSLEDRRRPLARLSLWSKHEDFVFRPRCLPIGKRYPPPLDRIPDALVRKLVHHRRLPLVVVVIVEVEGLGWLNVLVIDVAKGTVKESLFKVDAWRDDRFGGDVEEVHDIGGVMGDPSTRTFLVKDVAPDSLPSALPPSVLRDTVCWPSHPRIVNELEDAVYAFIIGSGRREIIGSEKTRSLAEGLTDCFDAPNYAT